MLTKQFPKSSEAAIPRVRRGDVRTTRLAPQSLEVLNAAHCGIVIVDDHGTIQAINPHFTTILGYAPDELEGRPLGILIPERFQESHLAHFHAYLQQPHLRRMGSGVNIIALHKSGAEVPVEIGLSPLRYRNSLLVVATVIDISSYKAIEQELSRAKDDLRSLIDNLPAMIGYWDRDLRNRFGNIAYVDWFGMHPDEMVGKHIREVIGEHLFAANYPYMEAVLKGEPQLFERTIVDPRGNERYSQASYIPDIRDGSVVGFFVLVSDITQRKRAEMALFEEKERARVTLSSIGDAVITTDECGNVTFLNPIAEEMTGWSQGSAIGAPIEQVMNIHNPETGMPMTNPVRLALQENRIVGLETNCVLQSRNNGRYYIEDSAAPIRDRDSRGIGAVVVFHDVSEARSMAMKMSHMAQHDALTDLPNRLLLQDRISQMIQIAQRDGTRFATIYLDLDNFKHINDSFGHGIGDDLLRLVAKRLTNTVRASDTVSRQGGDEFIVLLSHVESPEDASHIAQRLLEAVAEPFEVGREKLPVTVSVGISLFPDDGTDAATLLRHADAAMYRAKRAGRNRCHFFSRDIGEAAMKRHALERELRAAVENRELVVYYQLKVDASTNAIVGSEALVRWFRPGGEFCLPGKFIPVAEENGLIGPLGWFVLQEACRQNRLWQVSGLPRTPVAVNISAAQLKDPNFVPMVERILRQTGMAPEYLELEITEGTLIEAVDDAKSTLDTLRALHIRIALDDFGTGYSSLSHLKRFPVDTLKIDRTFVTDLLENSSNTAIISAIVGMGRGLGLDVIAEGVETQAQADALRALGCHLFQGFLYSHPLPPEQVTYVLESRLGKV